MVVPEQIQKLRRNEQIQKLRHNALFEIVFTLAIAIGLALCVQAYAVKPYRIPSGSMEPTLDVGQRVLVNRFSHRLGSTPSVGDVIVFHPPTGADEQRCGDAQTGSGTHSPCAAPVPHAASENFIKRVVAVGGDTIAILGGHAVRNGHVATEHFARACGDSDDCDFPTAIQVPHGYVFVMGDNRGDSDDSRFWGPVPDKWVIGEAFATYWPPKRIGIF